MSKINRKIKEVLKSKNIDINEGILYLLGIHFGIDTSSISEKVRKQVNLTGIVDRVYENNVNVIKWNVPIFEGMEQHWDWVNDWRQGFIDINPARGGTSKDCIKRMQKIFSEYPEIRKEDAYLARDEYFKTVNEPQYLKSANYFIWKDNIVNSLLVQFYEMNKTRKNTLANMPRQNMM